MKILTVATVCRNSQLTISDTINTVLPLLSKYKNIEYLIKDGDSNDKTLEIIKKLTSGNKYVKLYTHKDKGIYDAMNFVISKSSGKYLLFLNSDDIIFQNVFEEFMEKITNCNPDYFIAPVVYFERSKLIIKRYWILKNYKLKNFILNLGKKNLPAHPGFIAKTSICRKYPFDNKFSISADYLHIKSIASNNIFKKMYLNKPLVGMEPGGISNSFFGILIAFNQIRGINKIIKKDEFILIRYISNIFQYFLPFLLKGKISIKRKLSSNYKTKYIFEDVEITNI